MGTRKIAVIDLETDPFEHGKMIWPFLSGFYDGERFISWWSKDCVAQIVAFLKAEKEPMVIYAHNGGKFDFFYFLSYFKADMRIINGRIVSAKLGRHELRDSFSIMPFSLDTYKKTEIDYAKFTGDLREINRDEIIAYLRDDCIDLWTLCSAFRTEFGDSLTVGAAALCELKKHHEFVTGGKTFDDKIRKDYYFGGRCQVFKSGVIEKPVEVFDVNSMYPYVMSAYMHPMCTAPTLGNRIDKNTCFITVSGRNFGAFPVRQEDGSLDFTSPHGTFHTTIHEFIASEETGTFQPTKIERTWGFDRVGCFADFVNHFYDARRIAKEQGDKIKTIFYKFVLNSAYGKFAQNPERYSDWSIAPVGEYPAGWHVCSKACDADCRLRWSPTFINHDYIIWERPTEKTFYYNIAIGASITGAARAHLLKGLHHATNAYYCDTDSIICESITSVPFDNFTLGAWKHEASGTCIAVAGKKLYAIFDKQGNVVKKAHKGAHLSGAQIRRIASGETFIDQHPVPNFKFDGSWRFTERRIRKTA